jgi:hypothetical protein
MSLGIPLYASFTRSGMFKAFLFHVQDLVDCDFRSFNDDPSTSKVIWNFIINGEWEIIFNSVVVTYFKALSTKRLERLRKTLAIQTRNLRENTMLHSVGISCYVKGPSVFKERGCEGVDRLQLVQDVSVVGS